MPSSDLKKLTTESFIEKINNGEKDFSKTDLTEVDFYNIKESIGRDDFLSSLNMSGANLTSNKLLEMNLTGTNFSYANLTDVNFTGSNFSEANLIEADFGSADMTDASLTLSTFSAKTNFAKSLLTDVKFQKNFLYKINMSEINAEQIKFNECKIIKCTFSGGDSYLAEFLSCKMSDLDFSGERDFMSAKFESCIMNKLNFSENCLSLAIFEKIKSYNLNFTGAVLLKAEFVNSSLINADFTNANLTGAFFENCDFTRAKFTGVIQATCSEDIFEEKIEDYFTKCNFEEGEEIFKNKIDEIVSSISYLLEDGVLCDDQIKEILGPINEESGKSLANIFLTNLIDGVIEKEIKTDKEDEIDEEQIEYRKVRFKTLINRIVVIENRLRSKDVESHIAPETAESLMGFMNKSDEESEGRVQKRKRDDSPPPSLESPKGRKFEPQSKGGNEKPHGRN